MKIKRYTDIAIAYDFNFNITETNTTDGSLGFKLPFTSPAQLEIGTSASLHLTRQGQRQFKATDRWSRILARTECSKLPGRDRNIVYPISGSLGLDRLIHTFISISEQGGARDNFVETLTFTTEADASYTAGLKLNAKPQSLRLVSAGLAGAAGRTDVHRMIISLAFPSVRGPEAISGVERYDGDLNAPFDRSAPWRARYNLCVSDARGREDEFKVLRHQPPEVYCITYADAFAPGEGATVVVRARSTVTGIAPKPSSRSLERSSDERSIKPGTAPQERIILNRRPNLF